MNKALFTWVTGTLLSVFIALTPTNGRCEGFRSGDLLYMDLKESEASQEFVGVIFKDKDDQGKIDWWVYETTDGILTRTSLTKVLRRINYNPKRWSIKRDLKLLKWLKGKKKKELRAYLDQKLSELENSPAGQQLNLDLLNQYVNEDYSDYEPGPNVTVDQSQIPVVIAGLILLLQAIAHL